MQYLEMCNTIIDLVARVRISYRMSIRTPANYSWSTKDHPSEGRRSRRDKSVYVFPTGRSRDPFTCIYAHLKFYCRSKLGNARAFVRGLKALSFAPWLHHRRLKYDRSSCRPGARERRSLGRVTM